MSHFSVLVELPPGTEDVETAIGKLMAPFDENIEVAAYRDYEMDAPEHYWCVHCFREEGLLPPEDKENPLTWRTLVAAMNVKESQENDGGYVMHLDEDGKAYTMSTYNPKSKWDYWCIGGRWSDYFPVAPNVNRDLLVRSTGRGWDSPTAKVNYCDGGPINCLDLASLRDERAKEALAMWDLWYEIIDPLPPLFPWSHFVALHDADPKNYPIETARLHYRDQSGLIATRKEEAFKFSLDCPIDKFSVPRKIFEVRAREGAVPAYAHLTSDGEWLAPGDMGWFGMSTDNETDRDIFKRQINERIESLDPATILVVTDLHI